jgi:hypothetical protein
MFTLERETLQADTYTDPANSSEDEINAEEKPERGLTLASVPG